MRYVKIPRYSVNPWHQKRSNILLKKYKPILIFTAIVIFVAILFAFLSGPGEVFRFVFSGSSIKSTEDRVNVLILGNAGGTHAGPYLTDTVIVASYNLKTNKVKFFSLPRDLWLDQYKIKLNAVYETGQSNEGGLKFTKKVVGDILGINIHYGVRVDFRGFIKAVDEVGGLDVEVERSFEDKYFPITGRENDLCGVKEEEKEFSDEEAKKLNIDPGKRKVIITPDGKVATDSAEPEKGFEYFPCRFEQVSFDKGIQKMDGQTALKFVRSRMGTSGEASDFARSKRQQKIIDAFRKKILSVETLFNPKKIATLVATFGRSVETDIPIDDIVKLHDLSEKMQSSESFVISSSGQSPLLINPPPSDFGGAWVLIPKDGNFKEVQSYVKHILTEEVKGDETHSSARTSSSGF